MEAENVIEFLRLVEDTLVAVEEASNCVEDDVIEGVVLQMELLVRDVVIVAEFMDSELGESLIEAVMEVVVAIQSLADEQHTMHIRGRPQMSIPEYHLSMLLEHSFTVPAIASLFNVSSRTIKEYISMECRKRCLLVT